MAHRPLDEALQRCALLGERPNAALRLRKFDGLAYHEELTGSPVLDDALAWVDCRLHGEYDGGDHTIFVGEVLAGDAVEGSPLLYYRGGYGRFTP